MMRQYGFVDGRWVDVLNGEPTDDTPLEVDGRFVEGETWPSVILADAMGFCGCANIDLIVPLVRDYLTGKWGTYGESIIHFGQDDPTQSLVAWLCDAAALTEHGGNVGGSWLRPEGVRWLELCERDWTPS